MRITAPSPQFGQLKIDPKTAFAQAHANPQRAAQGVAEPFMGALRLLDMMEIDVLVKPSNNAEGDSIVLTHQNRPIMDLRKSIMYLPEQMKPLLENAVDRAIEYVGQIPRPATLGLAMPLKVLPSELITISE